MSRSVPIALTAAALLLGGCFDLSELPPRLSGVSLGPGAGDCLPEGTLTGVREGDVIRDVGLAGRGLRDRQGDPVSLYDGCGKVTLLGLGAGWCLGCREEMPHFVEWHEELSEDLAIYYVLWQNNASQPASTTFAAEWQDEYDAEFPIVIDPLATVRNGYAPTLDLPTTILIDRNMVIRKIRFYASVEGLRGDLDELIAE